MGDKKSKPKVKRKSSKRWGVQSVSTVTRTARDGSTYTEYRFPYTAQVVILNEQGEAIGLEEVRRFAGSSESPQAAKDKAAQKAAENKAIEEAFWESEDKRLGRFVENEKLPPPISVTPRRADIVVCAREMMRSRVKYEDGSLVGSRYGYERKQESYITVLQNSPLGTKPLDSLSLAEVSDWFIESYLKTHAQSTAARFKDWLIQVGGWAVFNKYWQDNLFKHLPKLSKTATRSDSRVYTVEEIDRMWLAARSPQEKAMLVLLRCGLRQGECLALSEDDLLDGDTIKVQYTLNRAKNEWQDKMPDGSIPKTVSYLGKPKTAKSQTKVHIPKVWMPILIESVELSTVCLVRAYDDAQDDFKKQRRFVLGNRFGLAWIEWCAAEALRHLMERAKVQVGDSGATFHAWRHSFCADLVALGCNDSELGLLMRHSDYNLSKAVYASARKSHLDQYKKYRRGIKNPHDYVDAIAKFDEYRRASQAH